MGSRVWGSMGVEMLWVGGWELAGSVAAAREREKKGAV